MKTRTNETNNGDRTKKKMKGKKRRKELDYCKLSKWL